MCGDHEIEKPFLRNEAKSKKGVRATAGPAGHLALPREIIAGIRLQWTKSIPKSRLPRARRLLHLRPAFEHTIVPVVLQRSRT